MLTIKSRTAANVMLSMDVSLTEGRTSKPTLSRCAFRALLAKAKEGQ